MSTKFREVVRDERGISVDGEYSGDNGTQLAHISVL
jgi:hypothetical protein